MAKRNTETTKEPTSNELALERTILAHERTLMGWVRTAASLITFGFTIYKFFQLELSGKVKPFHDVIGPRQFSILMISIGLLSLMIATLEYRIYRNGLSRWYPARRVVSLAGVVATLISIMGLVALAAVIFRM